MIKWLIRRAFRHIRDNLDVDISLDENILKVVVTYSDQIVFSKTINLNEQINV